MMVRKENLSGKTKIMVNKYSDEGCYALPSYQPALYRYMMCMGLSGNINCIEDCIGLEDNAAAMLQNIRLFVENKYYRGGINCGSDRDALGLLLPLAAAIGGDCTFTVDPDILNGSMSGLLKTFKVHGIKFEMTGQDSFIMHGKLTSGTYIVPSGTDPALLSGLLMALPLLGGNSTVMIDGPFIPALDVNLTMKALEKSNVRTSLNINHDKSAALTGKSVGASFRIEGGQEYFLEQSSITEQNWPY